MAFPTGPVEGEVYYTEKYVFEYSEGKWDSRVLSLDEINPNLGEGRGAFFPPFSAVATLRTRLSSPDDKIVFSTDKINYVDTITVDIGDRFFVEWATDPGILNAAQGSTYESDVLVEYLDLMIEETVNVKIISVDKVPNPFSFPPQINTGSDATIETATLAMLGSINAPTYLWGSSDSSNAQVNIAGTGWQSIPATPGSLVITSKDEIRTRHFTNTGSETVTTTTIKIGYADTPGAFESSDFVTTNESIGVQQPQITYPTGTGTLESLWSMPIQTTGYDTIGGAGGMTSARWEIATDSDFLSKTLDETVNGSSTNYNVPQLLLSADTDYFLRVTFTSSLGYSSTSLPVQFKTGKKLFSYANAARTWTIPTGLSQYHRVFMVNLGQGANGSGGTGGSNNQAGPGGAGGSQGTIRYRNDALGTNTTTIAYSTSGSSQSPFTDQAGQNEDANIGVENVVVGTDIDGNNITLGDVFAGMNFIQGSRGTSYGACEFCGGACGGGAGGFRFSYDPLDGTFETFGGIPSFPTGAKGGNNTPPENSGRQNQGADGGNGFGAGAGGGAGGPEEVGRYGSPGAGGSPGAPGASLIVIL